MPKREIYEITIGNFINFPRPPRGAQGWARSSTKRSLHAFALHIRAIPVQLLPGPPLFLFLTPTRL
jgi:hypothetical protein